MYKFIDTTESQGSASLPSEALNLNGEYIENMIPGYRTMNVKGRELLECEIDDFENGNADGTQYRGKRYRPRVITVTYLLMSDSNTDFREAYNKLNSLLDVPESTLIFADEPDKYFIGTKASHTDVTPGTNSVVGEIEFYCTNPFKYSTVETSFPASVNSDGVLESTIVNNGTESVPISYEITHNHENGYIGIVSEHGVMQYGCVDEVDKEVRQKSEILVNYKTGSEISSGMTSGGIVTEPSKISTNGTLKTVTVSGHNCLALDNVGSGSYWHGAAKTITIPADSDGDVGTANFRVQARVWFETGKIPQTGLMELVVGDEDGNLLCDIHLVKSNTANNNATCIYKLQGMGDANNDVCKTVFEPNYKSPMNGEGGIIRIDKKGELFTFYTGVKQFSVRAPKLAEKKALTVTVFLGQYGTRGASNLIARMYFRELSFRSDSVNYAYDIINRYQAGDVVTIDGESGKICTNGIPSLDDEMIGTKYFKAPPGETKVQFYYSGFCDPAPTITARIREAYL